MNYENMSDFEVNAAVSMHVLWKNRHCEEVVCNDKTGAVSWADGANWHEFNPCNNPSDAWPIIFDNEISMCKPRKGDDVWNCFNRNCDFQVVENLTYHQNPLRAAMIVFLKMQEAKRG